MPGDLRGAFAGCESVAMSTGHSAHLPRSSVRAEGIGSAGHGGHGGFVWCWIALNMVVAGPDVSELCLVNWNNKLVRTVFPF